MCECVWVWVCPACRVRGVCVLHLRYLHGRANLQTARKNDAHGLGRALPSDAFTLPFLPAYPRCPTLPARAAPPACPHCPTCLPTLPHLPACRIVSLVDIFEIDNNTFATVLELVQGGDLDAYCKLHEVGTWQGRAGLRAVMRGGEVAGQRGVMRGGEEQGRAARRDVRW